MAICENKITDLLTILAWLSRFNHQTIWLEFHSLEVLSRWRDPKLQVSENSDFYNVVLIVQIKNIINII